MTNTIEYFPIVIEQTDWQSAQSQLVAIRSEVFIDEQKVPAEEEVDSFDLEASHWIAWGQDNNTMGTARLYNNKLGRMAVRKPFRNMGVGSSLLRRIIAYAIDKGYNSLDIDAQQQAVGFYQDNGFHISGKTFIDAGIPHLPMSMDLEKYSQRRFEPTPPDISEELRQHVELSCAEDFENAVLRLLCRCKKNIRILSDHLNPTIFDNEELCNAVFQLITNHPHARVQLLVRDSQWLGIHYHRLVELYQRMSSKIEMRQLPIEIETPHTEVMTGDKNAIVYNLNPEHYRGYFCLHAPVEVRRLNMDFDALWTSAQLMPEVRRLYL